MNFELRTVMSCVGPAIVDLVMVSPSKIRLPATGLLSKLSAIDTVAPASGLIVTVDALEPPANVP